MFFGDFFVAVLSSSATMDGATHTHLSICKRISINS